MNADNIKRIIDGILEQKKALFSTQLETIFNEISSQMSSLNQFKDLFDYELPSEVFESGGASNVGDIYSFTQKIYQANTQVELITNYLQGVKIFCSRAALFLIKDDKLMGWRGVGFTDYSKGINDENLSRVFFSLSANTILSKVLKTGDGYYGVPESETEDHLLYGRFGGDKPDNIFVLPFHVNGKAQAVIYADSFAPVKIGEKEIGILSMVTELALELLPHKSKSRLKFRTRKLNDIDIAKKVENLRKGFGVGKESKKEDTMILESKDSIKTPPPTPPKVETPVAAEPKLEEVPTVKKIKKNDPERKARVICSDIIFYSKEKVEESRNNKSLYIDLKDTIDQAKEEYLRKFDDLTIFENALINILAKGDKEALQGYEFETQ